MNEEKINDLGQDKSGQDPKPEIERQQKKTEEKGRKDVSNSNRKLGGKDKPKPTSRNFRFDQKLSIASGSGLSSLREQELFQVGESQSLSIFKSQTELDDNSILGNLLANKIRSVKTESIAIPEIQYLSLKNTPVQTAKAIAILRAMKVPGVIFRHFNLNVGGFIPYNTDNYITGKNQDNVINLGIVEKNANGNILVTPYFHEGLHDSDQNNLIRQRIYTQKTEIKEFLSPISINKYTDSVLRSASGDSFTVSYKTSLSKYRRNFINNIQPNSFDGISSLGLNPALFRTYVEDPIMLNTLLYLTVKSINESFKYQSFVIDKLGNPDPVVSHIMSLSRHERVRLQNNINLINNFISRFPVNIDVINEFEMASTVKKLSKDYENLTSNPIIVPHFIINYPKTPLQNVLYTNSKLYEIPSGISTKLQIRLGSIFKEFLNYINIKTHCPNGTSLSLSKFQMTPYMSSFLYALLAERPVFLSKFLDENVPLWRNLTEASNLKDTIFKMLEPDYIDIMFRSQLHDKLDSVKPDDFSLQFLPQLFNISDKTDIIEYSIQTNGLVKEINLDSTINFLYTPSKISGKTINNGNLYVRNCIINTAIFFDDSKAVPFPIIGNLQIKVLGDKYTLTQGNNSFMMLNAASTLSVNPIINVYSNYDVTSNKEALILTNLRENNNVIVDNLFIPKQEVTKLKMDEILKSVNQPPLTVCANRLSAVTILGEGVHDSRYGLGDSEILFEMKMRRNVSLTDQEVDLEYQDLI